MSYKTTSKFILISVSILFVLLCVSTSLTKRPWSDEGWFAGAGYNLVKNGEPGTLALEPRGFKEGIDRYTYWTAPLYYPLQASWYSVFGFSLFSMRSLSTFFGLIYIFSWFLIAKKLFDDSKIALFTILLLACDYVVVMGGSFGRMDIICSAFGAAALAVYLQLREKNLTQAIFLSQLLVVCSGLTHFLGILYFLGVICLFLWFDKGKITLKLICISLIPYIVGSIGWGIYILQDPNLFVTQFFGNATDSGRMKSFLNPVNAIFDEIQRRYFVSYGLGQHGIGNFGPIYLKSLVLVGYIIGLIGVLFTKTIRTNPSIKLLMVIWGLFFIILTILDGQKLSYYLLNIIPLYTVFLSVFLVTLWNNSSFQKLLVGTALIGITLLQTAGLAYRMYLNGYGKQFSPAAQYLKDNTNENQLIIASAEMAFAFGFDGRIRDDSWFGYGKEETPDFIVIEEVYQIASEGNRNNRPEVFIYSQNLLSENYKLVYDENHYKIYQKISTQK